jgi:hypothetical protein
MRERVLAAVYLMFAELIGGVASVDQDGGAVPGEHVLDPCDLDLADASSRTLGGNAQLISSDVRVAGVL